VAATVLGVIVIGTLIIAWGAQLGPGKPGIPTWILISIVILIAAGISSIIGFAFSAIAGAMVLHLVPNPIEAVQIMMVASIGIQAYSVAGLARQIDWKRCAPFIIGGMGALPFGILMLLNLHPQAYVVLLGSGLIVYGLYMLQRRPMVVKSRGPAADLLIGALGGITGPLAAFPGACVTIWCGMRGWDKVTQRAVYQPYILIVQLAGLGGLLLHQRASLDPTLFAYALPGVAGAIIGLRAFHSLTDIQFHRLVNLALVASGTALLLK
jgi:uncharacterized membrane protein YfcA